MLGRLCVLLLMIGLPLMRSASAAPAPDPALAAAGGEWRTLTTPRYVIYSQLNEARTRSWAREFDLYIASATQLVHANVKSLPPTTVVLFARDRAFAQYKPTRPDGSRADNVAGYFYRRPSWGVIGLAGDTGSQEARHLIYHEATHWIMSTDANPRPKWFEEGMAEVLSSFEEKGSKVRWGVALQPHVDALSVLARVPVRRLFNLQDDDPMFNRDDRTGAFYSTSWLLTHYLLFGAQQDGRQKLSRYLELYRTMSPDEAFERSFGMPYEKLDAALGGYLLGGRYGISTVPEPAVPQDGVPGTPTPTQVHGALGRLAMATGNLDLARRHADEALSRDPSEVAVRELRALLAASSDNLEQARHEARLAARLGSRDAEVFLLLAEGEKDPRQRANQYERALMLAPRHRPAYAGLMRALDSVDDPTEMDENFLKNGRLAYPHAGALVFALARTADKRGDRDRARSLLEEATAQGMDANEQLLESVAWLRGKWAFEDAVKRVDEAMGRRDFAAAQAVVAELGGVSQEPMFQDSVRRMDRSIAALQRLDAAERAIASGRKAEARALLEQIAAMDDLPPPLRDDVAAKLRALGAGAAR